MIYDAEHFIEMFSCIPDEAWCEGMFDGPDGKHAAPGWCDSLEEIAALDGLFNLVEAGAMGVNDGWDTRYQQPTPRQRILAALEDVKQKAVPIFNTEKY